LFVRFMRLQCLWTRHSTHPRLYAEMHVRLHRKFIVLVALLPVSISSHSLLCFPHADQKITLAVRKPPVSPLLQIIPHTTPRCAALLRSEHSLNHSRHFSLCIETPRFWKPESAWALRNFYSLSEIELCFLGRPPCRIVTKSPQPG
jgi:hypothetical protein